MAGFDPKPPLQRIDAYFPRLSATAATPDGHHSARAIHKPRPARTGHDSASSSSSAKSYIIVPSDLAHNGRTRSSNANNARSAPKKATKTSSAATAPPRKPPSAANLPQRQPRQDAPKMKSSVKRKHCGEGESDAEPSNEAVHVRGALPTVVQVHSDLSAPSSRVRPLAPKDNVPATRNRANFARKPSPPKKARFSSPEPTMAPPSSGHDADVEELIPSSQSDEHELAVPRFVRKDPAKVKESVHKWRQEALAHPHSPAPPTAPLIDDSTPLPDISLRVTEDRMDVDEDMGPPPALPVGKTSSAPHSETEVSMMLRGRSSASTLSSIRRLAEPVTASSTLNVPASAARVSEVSRPITPPPNNEPAPAPSTPVALDTESKTAKIIAEIRAKAYAATTSSPDEDTRLEYQELEDSSSSDSDDDFLHSNADKAKGKAGATSGGKARDPFSSPLSNLSSPPHSKGCSTRYNLRHRSPVQSTSSSDEKKTSFYAKPAAKAKRRATNPLEALLKEKRLADKRGDGMSALRAAEVVAAASSSQQLKRQLMSEMDNEEDSEDRVAWANENAALQVVQRGARELNLKSSSPIPTTAYGSEQSDHDSESDEEDLQEADCEKILGEKGGKAVGKILASDRRSNFAKGKGKKKERVLGVTLWEDLDARVDGTDDRMQTDAIPPLPLKKADIDGQPVLSTLRDAVDRADASLLVTILGSGYLTSLEPQQCAALTPWLYDLAMTPVETSLSEPAYYALLHQYAAQVVSDAGSGIAFDLVLSTMVQLGAKVSILEARGWKLHGGEPETVASTRRGEILHRLVEIIKTCVQYDTLRIKDISDIILVLLLIALDPSTSPELHREIMVAIDYLGQAIPSDTDGPSEMETATCFKIIEFASDLTSMNKAHLMSFMMGGSTQTERMARWIARSLLLNTSTTDPCSNLPSLVPVIALLSPASASEALFDIPGNSDKDDYYEDLVCYVAILSKALTDIDGYVAEEKAAAKAEATPTKDGTPKEKPLEQIRTLLDGLHGKIVDTRAAHLDRSRAKAVLQRLSFRVHYQRLAALRSGTGTGKPRNLRSYFASPSK